MRTLGTLLLVMAVLWPAASAHAGSFLDRDARVFTVQPRLGSGALHDAGRLRALPSGDVVFVSGLDSSGAAHSLWWLRADGRLQRQGWIGRTAQLATEARGTVLALRADRRTLERFDLARRTRRTVARLPGRAQWLTALADGSIVAAGVRQIWWLRPGRPVRRVRFGPGVSGLAAWTRSSVAVLSSAGELHRVSADGRSRRVFRGAKDWLAAAGPGRVVTGMAGATPSLAVVDHRGRATPLAWAPPAFEGMDGLTASETPWPDPTSMAVVADGSLLLATAFGLRALVPADSPRARVAPVPQPFDGRQISYFAGVPGRLTAEVRRAGELRAAVTLDVPAGFGIAPLPIELPLDLYDVRLRLTSGTQETSGHARMGRRTTLTMEEARSHVALRDNSAGDEAGREGTEIGACRSVSPTVVECGVLWFVTWNDIDVVGESGGFWMPYGVVRALLTPEGEIRAEREGGDGPTPRAPVLSVTAAERQRAATAGVTVAVGVPGEATIEAVVRAGERSFVTLPMQRRTVAPGAPWDVRLALSGPARRWLRARRSVSVQVSVTVVAPVEGGTATLRRTTTFTLTR